jgi:hypothetical protein
MRIFVWIVFGAMLINSSAHAQTTNAAAADTAASSDHASGATASSGGDKDPVPDNPPSTTEIAKSKKKAHKSETSNDRLFFALPNFLTLEKAGDAPPLSAGEKFKLTARGAFDPAEFVFYGIEAGISQVQNHDSIYGQGIEGYSKRLGVRIADGTIEDFFTRAILPTALHEDPRYFQLGSGGFWHRASYSMSRIFVTRTDSGRTTFNFSEILGSAASSGISTYGYHPEYAHNISSALDVWGTQIGYDTLSYVLKEFWPDIRRKVHKDKSGVDNVH